MARSRAFVVETGCKDSSSNGSSSSDCSSGSMIDCLSQVPVGVLVSFSTAFGQDVYHYWAPLIFGDRFLPSTLAELLNSSSSSLPPLPILLGFNRDEDTLFLLITGLQGSNGTDLAYSSWVLNGRMEEQQVPPPLSPSQQEKNLSLYPPKGDGSNDEKVVNIISDAHYKCPNYFGEEQEDVDPAVSPIYFYVINTSSRKRVIPMQTTSDAIMEVSFRMCRQNLNSTPCGGEGEDEGGREEEEMRRTLRGYWGAFARTMGEVRIRLWK